MDELRVRVHADLQSSTMSVDEAAAILGQSLEVVWRFVRAGDLAHIRVQGAEAIEYRILAKDVHDLQAKLHATTEQSSPPQVAGPALPGSTQVRQPIADRLAAAVEGAKNRPSMNMMRPPTGPLKADPGTITRAGAFDAPSATPEPEGGVLTDKTSEARPDIPAADESATPSTEAAAAPTELEVQSFMSGAAMAPDSGTIRPTAVRESATTATQGTENTPVADAPAREPESAKDTDAPAPVRDEATPAAAPSGPQGTAADAASAGQAAAEAGAAPPKRPALPPINSIVTVSGSALHRVPQTGFDESDALRLFQSLMESLVAPITTANDRLADENSRLLELARMQSQALEKASAERDALLERLAVLPGEMRMLYERLGSLQSEIHRLEQERMSHGVSARHIAWWRRLFGLG